jgi:hypothetical protein
LPKKEKEMGQPLFERNGKEMGQPSFFGRISKTVLT